MKAGKGTILSLARGRSGLASVVQSLFFKLLIFAVNLLTGIITARLLLPEGRGELAAITLWVSFIAGLLTFGLPSALVFNLRRYAEQSAPFFTVALGLGVLLGVLAALSGIVLVPYWLGHYPAAVIRQAQILMCFAPFFLLMPLARAALEAQGDFVFSNATMLINPVLTLAGLAGLALSGTMTPFRAACCYAFSGPPVFGWMLVRLWPLLQVRRRGAWEAGHSLLAYGGRAYGIDLVNALAAQIDQVLVVGLISPATMGLYVVASSLSRSLNLFQQAVVMVLFPKATARPVEEIVEMTGRAARLSAVVILLVGGLVLLLSPLLVQVLYGAEFLATVTLLRLLVVEALSTSVAVILGQAFMAVGRPGVVTVLQALGLVVSVILLTIFIPLWGLTGAGVALLGASLVRLAGTLLCFSWLLKVRAPGLLITRDDLLLLWERLRPTSHIQEPLTGV